MSATRTVAELRQAFDESFTKPAVRQQEPDADLLLVRTRQTELALLTSDFAAIARCPALTAVPSGHRALCGLAGVRGALVAVYRLATLVGDERTGPDGGWVGLLRADPSAALQFDELVGYVRIPRSEIRSAAAREQVPGATEIVRVGNQSRAVIRMSTLLEDGHLRAVRTPKGG